MLVAVRKSDGRRIEGSVAERSVEYICPEFSCGHKVLLKKPLLKIDHFAHQPGAACRLSTRETAEHLRAKDFLLKAFRSRGLRAEAEVPFEILSGEEDRRADVVVWHPNKQRQIAFEIQHTTLGLKDIMRRTESYASASVPVVWINLLRPKRVENAFRVRGSNINYVHKYWTHAWERWAHDFSDERRGKAIKRGHLWFLDPSTTFMWRGWFLSHYLYKEGGGFYGASGEIQNYSGGWSVSERFHTLILEGPFVAAELRIRLHQRSAMKDGAFLYPGGVSAWLLAPADDSEDGPKRPPLRMYFQRLSNGSDVPRAQIYRAEEWVAVQSDQSVRASVVWNK
jgi:competence protein CoiA